MAEWRHRKQVRVDNYGNVREKQADGSYAEVMECAACYQRWGENGCDAEQMRRERDAARDALGRFGLHTPFCVYVNRGQPCDCGFEAALNPSPAAASEADFEAEMAENRRYMDTDFGEGAASEEKT